MKKQIFNEEGKNFEQAVTFFNDNGWIIEIIFGDISLVNYKDNSKRIKTHKISSIISLAQAMGCDFDITETEEEK